MRNFSTEGDTVSLPSEGTTLKEICDELNTNYEDFYTLKVQIVKILPGKRPDIYNLSSSDAYTYTACSAPSENNVSGKCNKKVEGGFCGNFHDCDVTGKHEAWRFKIKCRDQSMAEVSENNLPLCTVFDAGECLIKGITPEYIRSLDFEAQKDQLDSFLGSDCSAIVTIHKKRNSNDLIVEVINVLRIGELDSELDTDVEFNGEQTVVSICTESDMVHDDEVEVKDKEVLSSICSNMVPGKEDELSDTIAVTSSDIYKEEDLDQTLRWQQQHSQELASIKRGLDDFTDDFISSPNKLKRKLDDLTNDFTSSPNELKRKLENLENDFLSVQTELTEKGKTFASMGKRLNQMNDKGNSV